MPSRIRVLITLAIAVGAMLALVPAASAELIFDRGNDIYGANDDGSGLHLIVAGDWLGMDAGLGSPAVAPDGDTLLFRGSTLQNGYTSPHGHTFYGLNSDATYSLSGGQARRLDPAPAPARDPQGNPLAYGTGTDMAEPAPGGRYVYQATSCTEFFSAGFGLWTVGCGNQLESSTLAAGSGGASQIASDCDGTGSEVDDPTADPSSSSLRVVYSGCQFTPSSVLNSPKAELVLSDAAGQHLIGIGADFSHFADPSFSPDGAKVVAFNDGGSINDFDPPFSATITPGLYSYSDLSRPTAGQLLLAAPSDGHGGHETFTSPRFVGQDKIAFVEGGSVWTIPASCSACSFPDDATKVYDGGSDASTAASSVAWTSRSITPGSPPPPPSNGGGNGGSSGTGGGSVANGGGGPSLQPSTVVAKIVSVARARLNTLLAKGLLFSVSCTGPCVLNGTLALDGKTAHSLHLARAPKAVVIGRVKSSLPAAGQKSLTIKLSGKARSKLRHARSLKLTLSVVESDASGGHTTLTQAVRVKR